MTRDDDNPDHTMDRSRHFDAKAPGNNSRQEPSLRLLDDFHEDGYEEPDRDTNFASDYRTDSVADEDEYDHSLSEEDEDEFLAGGSADTRDDPDQLFDEDSDNWLAEETDPDEREGQGWPLGLIAIGLVALVLLAAGGYGVLQQRAATQAELQELRASLAVAARPGDAVASRDALEVLQQSYDTLSAQAQALTLENRRLADTVAGLEAQLGAQQSAPANAVPDTPVAAQGAVAPNSVAPTPAATPQKTAPPAKPVTAAPPPVAKPPAAAKVAASSPAGPWFVNFGTYATRNMADVWAGRVRPVAGEVIVAPNDKDGRTLYRVRVVGLADRESAQQVARKLETDLRVPPLWVGRE